MTVAEATSSALVGAVVHVFEHPWVLSVGILTVCAIRAIADAIGSFEYAHYYAQDNLAVCAHREQLNAHIALIWCGICVLTIAGIMYHEHIVAFAIAVL